MLTMTQVHNIRKMYFEEGKNISEIARETGYDRKTVRNYINKDDFSTKPPPPIQKATYPKLAPYKSEIDEWLLEDRKAKRKQRHTAQRVYNRLVQKHGVGFTCSYRTVSGYVAEKKKEIFGKSNVGSLPLEHISGEAQVDFGEAQFYENGTLYDGHYLNLSFPYSNQGYLQMLKGENQECLFEALKTIFEHIVGVPTRIWFDNTSTIVTQILKNGDRNLTEDFIRFKEHYRFQAAFCNPDAGHEKGNVENKVGYHRRNLLVPIPKINDLKDFNRDLLSQCDNDGNREHYRKGEAIVKLYQKDKQNLLELPVEAFDACKYITVKTNGYGRFYLNSGLHEYSISPKYTNSRILVKITAFDVIPLDESHREIIIHPRLYGNKKQQSMQWLPYLTQLSRCPGALKYTGIYQMLPDPIQQYLEKCDQSDKGKILKTIAALTEKSSFQKAVEAVSSALTYEATDVDSLINLHRHIQTKALNLDPIELHLDLPKLERYIPDLKAYDANLRKEGGIRC